MTDTPHEPTRTHAVIDTGAALASAGASACLCGWGQAIGSIGSSSHYNLSGKIGTWAGGNYHGGIIAVRSRRSREQHEHVVGDLREYKPALRAQAQSTAVTAELLPIETMPKHKVAGIEHQAVIADKAHEHAL